MRKYFRLAFTLIASGFWFIGPSQAETPIPGGVLADTLWAASGSPYLVQGTITIPDSAGLIIEPGVVVIFQGNYQFMVNGYLAAVGTATDSIVFTAANSLVGWGGLRLVGADVSSILEYCRFELGMAEGDWPDGCGGALYLYGAIQAVNHCSFVKNRSELNGGAVYLWGGVPEFAYNLFAQNLANNGVGHALCLGNCEGLILEQMTMAGNGSESGNSLYIFTGTNLKMRNSILWDSFIEFTNIAGDIQYCLFDTLGRHENNFFQNIGGAGNFGAKPYFVDLKGPGDVGNSDLRVLPYSRTIDSASPSAPWAGEPAPNGERANLGAYGNDTLATISLPLISFQTDSLVIEVPDSVGHFPMQKIFTTADDTMRVFNVGRQPLHITDLASNNGQFDSNVDSLKNPATGYLEVPADSSRDIILLFTPASVDSLSGVLAFVDNDSLSSPSFPVQGVGVDPLISPSQTVFDFPARAVGDTSKIHFTISNTGTNGETVASKLIIEKFNNVSVFRVEEPDGDRPFTDTMLVGQTREYYAVFAPGAGLDYGDSVEVVNNAGNIWLRMSGSGSQPMLDPDYINYDSLSYSVVTVGDDSVQTITLGNIGFIALALDSLVLSDDDDYSVEFDSSLADSIPTGGSMDIQVNFHPGAAGTYNRTLKIYTNVFIEFSGGEPVFQFITIHLFGTGTSQANWVIGEAAGTWLASQSPYYVVGDITIPSGEELTIQSGVQVQMEGNHEFHVSGTLTADGAIQDAIKFTTISADSHWAGITFKAGSSASLLRNCEFYRGADSLGGALRVEDAAPTIELCSFHDDSARRGGAIALLPYSNAKVNDCRFFNNEARWGGALYADQFSNSEVNGCEFYDNTASYGGAIYLSGALGKIHDCLVHDNAADSSKSFFKGGGIYIGDGAASELYGNEIYNNKADFGGGVAIVWSAKPYLHDEAIYANTVDSTGGGVYIQDGCSPIITKCLVVENNADLAKALHSTNSNPILNYCTLVAQASNANGWLLISENGDGAMITNSILWGTDADTVGEALWLQGSNLMATYTDLYGDSLFPGLNNLNDNPQFVDSGNIWQRYALQTTSLLKDAAEGGDELGVFGGSSILPWQITFSAISHPVDSYQERFVLTTTIPLLSLPYVYTEADFPDTVGYTAVDSAFMIEISSLIYRTMIWHTTAGIHERMTITFANIFGVDSTLVQEYAGAPLTASASSLAFGEVITTSARSLNGDGVWGIMPETYTQPKPLGEGLIALGQVYQIFASTDELASGQVEFNLTSEVLQNRAVGGCAVAFWSGDGWELLPSNLSSDEKTISAAMDQQGTYRVVWGENINTPALPNTLILEQNAPNPFNPETTIHFALPEAGRVTLDIFDLMGRMVAALVDGVREAGYHQISWRGVNQSGADVASGVYFYRLQAGNHQITKKMLLLR